jgi:hypothetical protein
LKLILYALILLVDYRHVNSECDKTVIERY